MKNYLSILLILWMSTNLFAQKVVTKTVFVNQANHADKSMEEIKGIVLQKAKIDAASEIFGDFIKSEATIENGALIRNMIISEKNGVVHLKGAPKYANGKNFGDIQVTITAYATDEDIRNMSIQKIVLTSYIYTNPNLPLKDLKRAAEDAFLVEALSQKRPSLKNSPNQKALARELAVSVNIQKMLFDVDTCSYAMNGEVEYIPFFLKNK